MIRLTAVTGYMCGSVEEPYQDTKNTSALDTELVTTRKLDAGKALMQLDKDNTRLIVKALYDVGGVSFSQLQKSTAMSNNQLNYTLAEMKTSDLIVQVGKRYYLTKYCIILLEVFSRAKTEIDALIKRGDKPFAPYNGTA